jgi:hypothetical protein
VIHLPEILSQEEVARLIDAAELPFPVYEILEARGLEVYLVNAQHVKNVSGRKTDVFDCQGLQYLRSVGCCVPASGRLDLYALYGLSGDIEVA